MSHAVCLEYRAGGAAESSLRPETANFTLTSPLESIDLIFCKRDRGFGRIHSALYSLGGKGFNSSEVLKIVHMV